MMRLSNLKPRFSTVLTAVAWFVLGGCVAGYVAHRIYWHYWQLANREYKAAIAELSARTLARLRTGTTDDAILFLEDHVDHFMVGVPMGETYEQLSYTCQHALSTVKIYRSRFPFPGKCKVCAPGNDDLHVEHAPGLLRDVPLLDSDHDWLDGAMRKVRALPPTDK